MQIYPWLAVEHHQLVWMLLLLLQLRLWALKQLQLYPYLSTRMFLYLFLLISAVELEPIHFRWHDEFDQTKLEIAVEWLSFARPILAQSVSNSAKLVILLLIFGFVLFNFTLTLIFITIGPRSLITNG